MSGKRDPLTVDPLAPLYAARLKVARAQTHLNEVGSLVAEFLDAKPYAFRHHFNSDDNLHTVTLDIADPPITLALAIGDCIHNLRSALDIMAVELSREGLRLKGKEMSRTQIDEAGFPITANQAGFDATGPKKIKHWPPAAKTLMGELQPFKDGAHPWSKSVWTLHQLDILDKHKLLIPIGAMASMVSWTLGFSEAVIRAKGRVSAEFQLGSFAAGHQFPLKNGDLVMTYSSPDPEPQTSIDATFDVAFGKDQIIDGVTVRETLVEMGQIVDSIVETMATKAF